MLYSVPLDGVVIFVTKAKYSKQLRYACRELIDLEYFTENQYVVWQEKADKTINIAIDRTLAP